MTGTFAFQPPPVDVRVRSAITRLEKYGWVDLSRSWPNTPETVAALVAKGYAVTQSDKPEIWVRLERAQ